MIPSRRLVGRDDSLNVLREGLLTARGGKTSVVLVSGEAGLGKSALVGELVDRAHRHEVAAIVGHAVPLSEGPMPFGPVADALRALLAGIGPRLPELVGPDRKSLAAILPELGPSPERTDAGGLLIAIRRVLSRATDERPLVLALEDLHWADRQTLDLLSFLARTVHDDPLLIVATFRPAEAEDVGIGAVVAELERLPSTTHVVLSPLSDDDVDTLVARILGAPAPPQQLRHVRHLSGGNPFLVEELLASGVSPGDPLPSSLRRVVLARVRDVPLPVRRVLDAVAVAGASSIELLARVLDLPVRELNDVVRTARDRGILVEQGDRVSLRHDLIREALYAELLGSQRRELHAALATSLAADESLTSDDPLVHGAELAHHLHGAGRVREAYSASRAAAAAARALGADGDALPHLERALELAEEVDPDGLGQLLDEVIEVAHKVEHDERVIELVARRLDGELPVDDEARLQARLANVLFSAGRSSADVLAAAQRALDLAPGATGATRVRVLQVAAHTHMILIDQDPRAAVGFAAEAYEEALDLGDPLLLHAASLSYGAALGWVGRTNEAIPVLEASKRRAIAADDPARVARILSELHTQIWRRDLAAGTYETLDVVTEGLPWIERLNETDGSGSGHELVGWAAMAYLRAGQFERAEWAVRRFERFPLGPFHVVWRDVAWGYLLWMRGDHEPAQRLIDRDWTPQLNPRWYHDVLPLAAQLAVERGDVDEVSRIAAFHAAVDVHPDEESKKIATMLRLVRAQVDAALQSSGRQGRHHADAARRAGQDLHDHLDRFPPPTVGSVQNEQEATYAVLADAELSRLDGGEPDVWREAIRRAGFVWWKTYARMRLVEALVARGERDLATSELAPAHQQAKDLGAASLVDQIEDLARRARLPLEGIQRIVTLTDLGLTERETEVLRLVAGGRTNREIGQALFITPTTASVHVSNILAKLDVRSRYEAADLVRDADLLAASQVTPPS